MREKLEEANLVTISVNISEVKWTHKGEEAVINGNLFDVENYSIKGDNIQLTGLFDKDEDKLVAQIENSQKNNSDNSNNNSLVFQWLGCFSLFKENNQTEFLICVNKQKYTPIQIPIIINADLLNDTPPPKLILS
jgi:hypothetical protein